MPKVMTAVVSCACVPIRFTRLNHAPEPARLGGSRVVFIRLGFLVLTTRSAEYISTIVFVIGKPYKVKSYDDTVSSRHWAGGRKTKWKSVLTAVRSP